MSTIAAIHLAERELQAAWARRDGPRAQELRARLRQLWAARRLELAGRAPRAIDAACGAAYYRGARQ